MRKLVMERNDGDGGVWKEDEMKVRREKKVPGREDKIYVRVSVMSWIEIDDGEKKRGLTR